MLFINLLLPVSALIGTYYIAQRKKIGFIWYFVTEVCTATLGVHTKQYGFVLTAVLYFLMNIYAYKQWTKKPTV